MLIEVQVAQVVVVVVVAAIVLMPVVAKVLIAAAVVLVGGGMAKVLPRLGRHAQRNDEPNERVLARSIGDGVADCQAK